MKGRKNAHRIFTGIPPGDKSLGGSVSSKTMLLKSILKTYDD